MKLSFFFDLFDTMIIFFVKAKFCHCTCCIISFWIIWLTQSTHLLCIIRTKVFLSVLWLIIKYILSSWSHSFQIFGRIIHLMWTCKSKIYTSTSSICRFVLLCCRNCFLKMVNLLSLLFKVFLLHFKTFL